MRWQAAIALGEFCQTDPEAIWPLTVKWGSSNDADVRAAVGTCVLEHILEYHFSTYFPKVTRLIYDRKPKFCGYISHLLEVRQCRSAGKQHSVGRFETMSLWR